MADAEDLTSLFQEPADYYTTEKLPTEATHKMLSGNMLTLRLVGHNPLWGHLLWNAGRTISHHLEKNADLLIKDKCVLELGAGAGLPSIVCALKGAQKVVVTDYPDPDLIENLCYNISRINLPNKANKISAVGYLWGAPVHDLLSRLCNLAPLPGFDLVILADLLFNHSEHFKLASSIQNTLKHSSTSRALVFFTPYRPWLLQRDLAFFDFARNCGLEVQKIFEEVMDRVMFDEDPGDELLRRTVYGYELKWKT